MKKEVFVSIDIEADGPIPALYSMLSLGAVAFDELGNELDSFSVNLERSAGAAQHPDTMKWWESQPEAWAACQKDKVPIAEGMRDFADWVKQLPGRPVAVCYPAGFDWPFIYYYLMAWVGKSPFGFQCLDMKTYAAATLNTRFRDTVKRKMPKAWFNAKDKHTHVAVEDAREQGKMFFRMKRQNERLHSKAQAYDFRATK